MKFKFVFQLFKAKRKTLVAALLSLIVFGGVFYKSHYKIVHLSGSKDIGFEVPRTDVLEYHFLAANLALAGSFPLIGFIAPENQYHIGYHQHFDELYLGFFRKYGPVYMMGRSPLYPLLLGITYHIFGIDPVNAYYLNALLFATSAALLVISGYILWSIPGAIAGFCATALYYYYTPLSIFDLLPDYLLSCVTIVSFVLLSTMFKRKTYRLLLMAGYVIGVSLLVKELAWFTFFFAIVYLSINKTFGPWQKKLSSVACLSIGLALAILPYTIVINHIQNETVSQREQWRHSVQTHYPDIMVDSYEEIESNNLLTHMQLFDKLMHYLYLYLTRSSGFILITNQVGTGGEGFLHLNNEYLLKNNDFGGVHFEWMFIRNSYYQTHYEDSPPWLKVLFFYRDNPTMLSRVLLKRISSLDIDFSSFFWLGLAMLFLSIWYNNHSQKIIQRIYLLVPLVLSISFVLVIHYNYLGVVKWLTIPLLAIIPIFFSLRYYEVAFFEIWLNTFFFVTLFYGDSRFVVPPLPLLFLFISYINIAAVAGLIKTNDEQNSNSAN